MLQRPLGAFHDSSRGNVQCCLGTQAEHDYIASSSQSSPSGWRTCDIPTRLSRQPGWPFWQPGFTGMHGRARCRWRCRGQLPLPSRRTQLGDVFCQSTWAELLARFPSKCARGGSQGRTWKPRGWPGTAHRNQDVHFTENPVEEAEEHGYKEEPMLQNDMDTEAEGHGGEPSQEEQHWLENYNLDDQE
jgi:hypothetical protein